MEVEVWVKLLFAEIVTQLVPAGIAEIATFASLHLRKEYERSDHAKHDHDSIEHDVDEVVEGFVGEFHGSVIPRRVHGTNPVSPCAAQCDE